MKIEAVIEAVQKFAQVFKDLIPAAIEDVLMILGHNSSSRSLPHIVDSPVARILKLLFVGTLPDTFLTFNNIQDEGASLEVELRDSSGCRIEDGPEAFVKIKIFVLDGDFEVDDTDDWTHLDFDKNIAQPRKDKGPLLKGKCEFFMRNGVASVSDIAFTDNSKSMRNGKFRLGARVVKGLPHGVEIRDAVSEAFKVKERRVQSYRKHRTVNLEDSTHCLKHVGQTLSQRLAYRQIHTVKDFLQLYHTDANALHKILGVAENKWLDLVNDGNLCLLTDEHYRYYDKASGVHLLLDCVFNIVGVTLADGISKPYEDLADSEKQLVNKIRLVAYEERKELQRTHAPSNLKSVRGEEDRISSQVHTAEPELLSLMLSQPGIPVGQTQDLYPQHQSSDSPPNNLSIDGAEASLHDQLRLDPRGDTLGVLHGANVPQGSMRQNKVEFKRQRLT